MELRVSLVGARFRHKGIEYFVLRSDEYMYDAWVDVITLKREEVEFRAELFSLPFGAVSYLKARSASITTDSDFNFSRPSRTYWEFVVQSQAVEKI